MSIRRNFIHNCITHPYCGVIWLIADIGGVFGLFRFKATLVQFGERVHSGKTEDANTSCGKCHYRYLDESGCDPCPICGASYFDQIFHEEFKQRGWPMS